MYVGPMDMDNGVGIDYGSGGCGLDRGGQSGKNWDNCNSIKNGALQKKRRGGIAE